jgi:hypothetical protein
MRSPFLVAAGIATLIAQLATPRQPTFRTGVDVVQVDVSVLDKDRRPLRGLTQADFTISRECIRACVSKGE